MISTEVDILLFEIDACYRNFFSEIIHSKPFSKLEQHWRGIYHLCQQSFSCLLLSIQGGIDTCKLSYLIEKLTTHLHTPGLIPISISILLDYEQGDLDDHKKKFEQVFSVFIGSASKNPQRLLRPPYRFERISHINELLWSHPGIEQISPLNTVLKCKVKNNNIKIEHNLLVFRLIHALLIMMRNSIGLFYDIEQYQLYLQNWLHQYCSQNQNKPNYPLEIAIIRINKGHQLHNYTCDLQLKLHANTKIFHHKIPIHGRLR